MEKSFNASQKKLRVQITGLVGVKSLLIVMVLILLFLIGYVIFRAPRVPGFAHGSALEVAQLKSEWASGNLIILVRHAERCDQSTAVCLDALDGITERGKEVAVNLGAQYKKLGLNETDIFTSPLTRTQQTADYMFSRKVKDQEWLANCKDTMLQSAISHKANGRNLILVTHSDCMKDLEKSMFFSTSKKPGYSSSLIISLDKRTQAPQLLGIINSEDWQGLL
ncbi:Phosphohistidine phosphatase SixA [Pseudomonas sp. LAMO17WK12:I10]|uniref:lipopolysaccharide core heptose(II)-phosphate phosphatase PmrG n=1 Tax=unclassified Pseudomonas TaxID=196821 RepID=UPI000BC3EDF1|nr:MULTISPECIES: histidine phosphatase family protein [unclassified Pseudomonas]PXX64381.1 phosphohistidine phosphatase SixA [Pseudomonas sp. LAMO17WK12:I9]SNY39518.1 Phosphohistidine phosphatase SixA [Pseudomonas sp. LAMO17WK12:I10]